MTEGQVSDDPGANRGPIGSDRRNVDETGENRTRLVGEAPSLQTVGKVIEVVREQLRKGQVDEKLLKQLGWDDQQLAAFVKKYDQLFGDRDPEKLRSQLPTQTGADETKLAGEDDLRFGSGADERLRGKQSGESRSADDLKELIESGRLKLGPEYQRLLEEYYKALARTTTRPSR